MLMCIGASVVEVYPLNFENVDRKSTASFAEKSVVGRRPLLEAVGEGEETFELLPLGRSLPMRIESRANLRFRASDRKHESFDHLISLHEQQQLHQ